MSTRSTLNIELVQLKSGKNKSGIYHIQHINSYHSQLKIFMNRFRGVASKYMGNYLIWNNLVNYAREDLFEKKGVFVRFVLSLGWSENINDISSRKAIPI